MDPQFGVVLPHFGERRSPDELIGYGTMAEDLGFASVWTRDHVFISGAHRVHGGIEETGFITEALLTLAAVGARTSRVMLGTAVLTPQRPLIKTAQLLGTLSYLSGGRVICGIGAGNDPEEFQAVGVSFDERIERVRLTIEACKGAWSVEGTPAHSQAGPSVDPVPHGELPFWYGGLTRAAAGRAVAWCDGWLPSRVPFARLEPRIDYCKDLARQAGKADFVIGTIPQVAIARSREEALDTFNRERLAQEARRLNGNKIDGGSAESLEGMIIWGTPSDICGYVERFLSMGVGHVIFDCRASSVPFEVTLRSLGQQVLPHFGS